MPYSQQFKMWWKERKIYIRKGKRAKAKRWAWIGWQALIILQEREEAARNKLFNDVLVIVDNFHRGGTNA